MLLRNAELAVQNCTCAVASYALLPMSDAFCFVASAASAAAPVARPTVCIQQQSGLDTAEVRVAGQAVEAVYCSLQRVHGLQAPEALC